MEHDEIYAMRHSLAHITAQAVQHLWPEAKFGVGPVVENGFYYDIDLGEEKVSEEDFKRIEKEMRKIIAADFAFERSEKPIDAAIEWAHAAKQPYKLELLNDLQREGTTIASELDQDMLGLAAAPAGILNSSRPEIQTIEHVSFYTDGDFTDLCRGPHIQRTGKVGAFKLMRVAGAYWRGKEGNPQMQRLYGVAFATREELDQYLEMLEEAKKRDHRKLGQELDLFFFSPMVGPGLPLFTPRGTILREEIGKFSQELQSRAGYQRVAIPHIARTDLYKTSGHYDKYPERFIAQSFESDDEFMLKPMNCPHHTQIYASRPRSYRDLPIRYMENTVVYRDEKAGELHGLSRVRAATQDDAHVFARFDQIEEEFTFIMTMIRDMYSAFGLEWRAVLSFRDNSDKYLGDEMLWAEAQGIIEKVAKNLSLNYTIEEGEAAFYGPKIDIMVKDALGREWQLATEQLDFVQPERFNLEYTDDGGEKQRPVMIHKALLGSLERFLSVYIEHTGGRFPVWLAPEQLRIIQVKDSSEVVQFVQRLRERSVEYGIRCVIDDTNESVGKKIRAAATMKVPYSLVIGEKEVSDAKLTPRIRGDLAVEGREEASYEIDQFFRSISNEVKTRASKSSI